MAFCARLNDFGELGCLKSRCQRMRTGLKCVNTCIVCNEYSVKEVASDSSILKCLKIMALTFKSTPLKESCQLGVYWFLFYFLLVFHFNVCINYLAWDFRGFSLAYFLI